MGDRRCCCEVECWQYLDDFNDPDTDTPVSWYEQVGQWGIAGFVLIENYNTGTDGTSGAKIVCTEQQPAYHAGEQYLSIDVYDPQDGDKYYLYPCAPSATSAASPVEVEFECITAPAIWLVTIGTETASYTDVTATGSGFVRIGACVDGNSGMAKAWMTQSAQQGLWNDDIDPGKGRYSAVGHNNTGHLNTFDNYDVGELRDRNDVVCFPCFCTCRDHFLKKRLNLRIYNATGRADCMDGKSGEMVWEWNAGDSRWAVTLTGDNWPEPEGDGSTWERTFYLYCEGEDVETQDPGDNFVLVHDPYTACCNGLGTEACDSSRPSYAECLEGSMNLTFGPFRWTYAEMTCYTCYKPTPLVPPAPPLDAGEYYVVITD